MADGKRCIICGEDCTDRPRIKDGKGQYACRACVEKKQAGKKSATRDRPDAAPKAAPDAARAATGAGMMEHWASRSAEGQIALGEIEQPKCPKCEHPMMPDAVVCMGCGFNTQSGKRVFTRVQKAEKDKSSGGGGISLGGENTVVIVGLLGAIGLIAASALLGEMGIIFAGVAALWTLAAWIMMIVAAFQDGDSKWGIMGLCSIIPCLGLPTALAFTFYYCIVGSTRTSWKANYWLSVLAYIGCYAAVMINNPEMLSSDF
tara:strand:- start:437 stop:1216 length:780 start_codon:yes stop_codon:yes gene_type:complete